ncbi:MAG: flagellar basal body protein [Phycisphaerae bacterium]|nr:flagellar basal body protein [Phycisphaerae bacterium]
MFDRIVNGGNIPALERALQFSSARQQVIANNLANIETPGFRPTDVSPVEFQQALAGALEARQRAAAAGVGYAGLEADDGGLELQHSDQIRIGAHGLELSPAPIGDGILFHDGNDRNMERILQSLTENLTAFRFAATLMRRQFASLETAIRERM